MQRHRDASQGNQPASDRSCIRLHVIEDKSVSSGIEQLSSDDITNGDVVIKVNYATISDREALAEQGRGRFCESSR